MFLCSSCDSVPLKKEKQADLQFTGINYLRLVLAPLRIRWTIPLRRKLFKIKKNSFIKYSIDYFSNPKMMSSNFKKMKIPVP
jgi:hypothetical protein